jgi:hypothetical protein
MHSLESAGHVILDGSDATLADELLVSADKVKAFVELQKADKTLDDLRFGKGKHGNQIFFPPPHGLMYRRAKIGGIDIDQLVLPESKRLEVVKCANDYVMFMMIVMVIVMSFMMSCSCQDDVKLVRSFLGMCAFYKGYIANYSALALPLTDLTKAKVGGSFSLNEEQRAAFNALKQALVSPRVLATPDYTKEFYIYTDASLYACGCVCSQLDEVGQHRPVAFASKKFTPTETRYSVIEREAYAVLFALQKFDMIVFGSRIVLYSDHNPLQYIANGSVTSSKLTRWSLSLSRYDIEIRHVAGELNSVSDLLSRLI